jgi:integrase
MNTTPHAIESEIPSQFPFVVTRANVSVRIYRVKSRNKNGWCYQIADYTRPERGKNGKPVRTLRSFADFAAAKAEAVKIASLQSKGDSAALNMTGAQASEYGNAVQLLAPFKITLGEAIRHCVDTIKILGGDLDKMPVAAKFYVERHAMPSKTVSELMEEMLTVKRARKMSASYLNDLGGQFGISGQGELGGRFGRFRDSFGSTKLADISTNAVQKWLDALGLSPQSYMNYRRVLFGLFRFAETRGYIAKGTNPFELVERLKTGDGDVEIFTPAELFSLLMACKCQEPDSLASLVIGAFAGLRSGEIQRLEWSDIDLPGKTITVSASKAKTASRRTVPICAALAAWLATVESREGKVWKGNEDGFVNAQRRVAKVANVSWKGNGLRHSYTSYRLADTGDATRTAYELGNSPAVVHRYYKALVKTEDAKAWFSIFP